MKKKIFVAALASLCVAVGAAGIAACGGNKEGNTHDPALYAAYQTYAAENENPKTYEEWVADLVSKGTQGDPGERGDDGKDGIDGEDGVGIDDVKMVEIQGKQYFEFLFSNGKIVRIAVDGSDRQVSTEFTVTAIDNNGNPVEDAYFNVGYTDSFSNRLTKDGASTTNSSAYYAAKTNAKGIATFFTFPEDLETDYSVYLADPYSISSDGRTPNVPEGYTVDFGKDSYGMNNLSAPFVKDQNGNYSATVNFVIDNSLNSLGSDAINYRRYVQNPLSSSDKTEESDITVVTAPLVKKATRGKYNYLSFSPYFENRPSGELDDSQIQQIIQKAREAASGVYRFSFTASNSRANVQLNLFSFIGGNYYVKNDDGSPADTLVEQRSGKAPTDEKTLQAAYGRYQKAEGTSARSYAEWLPGYTATFSGGNYVDLTVEEDTASASFLLGFTTEINCDVTITVERIGNVTKWTDEYEVAKMPANQAAASKPNGRLLEVPLDSVIVRDSKGGYHLNSETGPEIYVQLKNATRANENSMLYLTDFSTPEVEHASVFNYYTSKLNPDTDTGVRTHTDYTTVVQGYAALANADGGYPVNDLLKTILENFCRGYIGWSNYDEYWVAACYYYGAPSDGSEASPYDLITGDNSVTLRASGTTYLSFRPTSAGYYSISVQGCTIGNVQNAINVDGTNYVYVSNSGISFTVTGSGTATVTIGTIAAKNVIEYYVTETDIPNPDPNEEGNIIVRVEHGTEETPLECVGSGIYQVNIDHSAYSDKIVVNFTVMFLADGKYKFEIFGSNTATIEMNGVSFVSGNSVELSSEKAVKILIDDVNDGTFFIKITKIS